MVAQWLTAQPVVRPVIIHSSNGERSAWMAGAFALAGWRHYRVAPLGDDWVECDWRRLVRRQLAKAGRTRRSVRPRRACPLSQICASPHGGPANWAA